jgi:UDP-GlcNAc:undecaprenyl-phosphate/decaprenyl-phosphate GlcNAc-1-phosphate transferase
MTQPFLQLVLAVIVSMLVIPVVRRLAPRLGLVDLPDPRKVHTVPTPRVGGWGITLAILVTVGLAVKVDALVLAFLIGCLTLFAFGVWDDAHSIGHWKKFVGQLIAVALVVYYGDLWVARVPFIEVAIPPWIGKPFTMFALIGVINAINHSDGLDGLAGGEAFLSLLALTALGYTSGSPLMLSIALATIGGIFGFLRYNSHPAYVFMGDCGSQVLGFTLGFLVVHLTQTANTEVSAALPLLILGVPIADILSVLYRRIRGRLNWFKATRNHLHHRLLQLGFDHHETVVIIYSVQAAFVVSAVLACYQSDVVVALIYLAGIAALFCAVMVAERSGWHVARAQGAPSRVSRAVARLTASDTFIKGPLYVIAGLTPIALLLSAVWVADIPKDLAPAAAVIAAVPAIQLLWPQRVSPALLRVVIYATAMFPAWVLINEPQALSRPAYELIAALIVLLLASIVLYMRLDGNRRFETNPTDYLIACGVVALLVCGVIGLSSRNVVEAILLATVLMYAAEIIVGSGQGSPGRRWLEYSTLGTLLIISLRGAL